MRRHWPPKRPPTAPPYGRTSWWPRGTTWRRRSRRPGSCRSTKRRHEQSRVNIATALDHVGIAVPDLEGAAQEWRLLGFAPMALARHDAVGDDGGARPPRTGNCAILLGQGRLQPDAAADGVIIAADARAELAALLSRAAGVAVSRSRPAGSRWCWLPAGSACCRRVPSAWPCLVWNYGRRHSWRASPCGPTTTIIP